MACRISSAHVCQIAKSVVQQAKDTSANHLLKPGSRELSRVRHKKKEISPEKYPSKECQRESPKKTNSDAQAQFLTGEFKKKDAKKSKSKPSDNINDLTPSSIFDYFKKLYDEEETKRLFLHLQPNNIQPFGSGANQYTPALFKRRSSSADCQYFSKNVAEKIGYCGKLTTSQSNYVDFRSNTNNVKGSLLDDILMKKDDAASKTLNTRIFSAPEPINSKHSEGDSSRFISSFKELLEEKSMLAKNSSNKSSSKHSVSDEIYGTQGDLSIVSTKPSNPKLFGSRFNRSPLIGPQYLQDTYANLRSVCGVIRTNDTCGKVTIKKITKKKKTLPKLTLMKCPSIAASLTKMKNVTLVPLKKSYEPQDPIRCEEKKDEICQRADDDWKLTAKPFSKIADCPKVTSVVQMKNCPPIVRLAKTEIPEPLKKCKETTDFCAPRSDASLRLRKRDLPQIPCGTFCRPSLEFVPGEPFPRLKKFPLKDPPRVCPKEEPLCERINENLQVKPKCLPELVLKCPPPIIEDKLIDCKKLKRPLARKVEVVRKPCIKPPGPCDNPIRADDNKKFGPKKLPKYEASKCKLVCVPPDMKEGESLQRPKKQYDPRDPIRKCKTSLKCMRDRIPVVPKILPKVECTGQATYPPVVLTEGIPIKRMEKKKIPEPERICPMKHICDTKRADAKLSVKKSCLPRLITKCPAPPQYIPEMKKCPLKRLPKVVLEEPKKICPETIKECIRADEPYKEIKKCLPIFKSSECPMDISPTEIKDSPALKRLCPRKISQSRDCPTKQVDKCVRSDMDDWDYIIERSCYPFQDKCRQKIPAMSTQNVQ